MENRSNNFITASQIAISTPELRAAVAHGTSNAYNKRLTAMYAHSFDHGEAMRQQAAEAKRRMLRSLPDLLELAEKNLRANGFEVLWAADAAEANRLALDIIQRHGAKTVAKVKSMLTEEIGLNHVLEDAGLRVIETDLGEYIIQLNGEAPSHIVAPVIHKTKPQIRDIFVDKLGMTPTDDAAEMVAFARLKLRQEFLDADLGISGANFVIAETGSVCLVTNEGNGRMCTSLPRTHIAMVGIEKLAATLEDYATLTQVLPRSGTGQNLTVYTSILNGPRRPDESDGPEHAYVIFVDNGRSDIYATTYAEVLACLRCGACLNACPVYRSTGGHAYGWVYGGPIGAVLTPLLVGKANAHYLPYASSLCGACKAVCPVDIDLPRMLLELRKDLVEDGETSLTWDWGMKGFAVGMGSPMLYGLGSRMARTGIKFAPKQLPGVLGNWTQNREFPPFAPKPFRQLWRERQQARNQGAAAHNGANGARKVDHEHES
jgi:L-lactate dehydrogenase complex protein LldF